MTVQNEDGEDEMDVNEANRTRVTATARTSACEAAARAIVEDLTRRKGLKQEWDEIDEQTREEIVQAWERIILENSVEIPVSTVVQLATGAIEKTRVRLEEADDGFPLSPRREFALAITAFEEAAMRYTRGRAIELGVFKPADLDRREAIEERHEWTGKALEAMDAEKPWTPDWPQRPSAEQR